MTLLSAAEVKALTECFPELSWMKPEDWQKVAEYAGWRAWLDEQEQSCEELLRDRKQRIAVRWTCRCYFGEENVPNINDPTDETWR